MKKILRQTVTRLNRFKPVNVMFALKIVHKRLIANLRKLSGKEIKNKPAKLQSLPV